MTQPPEVETENRPNRQRKSEREQASEQKGLRKQAMLSLSVLGVVYGDLGTSAIYALHAVFNGGAVAVKPNTLNVFGVLSLVFWTLVIVVSLKYMIFILRADNHGEGGIFALIALLRPWRHLQRWRRRLLILLGLAGAAMLYAGVMITPAISILSAVEGLEIASPQLGRYVLPITVVILLALFAVQRFGTSRIGYVFGPIMLVWFMLIGALGIYGIVQAPQILLAINPMYAVRFFLQAHWAAFLILFAVFLVTTGAEALYADIGHFGRKPIRRMWFCFVLPALLLNYFGQGAMLLQNPGAKAQPFFHLSPDWLLYPVVGVATLATVIASQAVISGAFSMTRQAARLGMVPRTQIVQTSKETAGQIYVPFVNWLLLAAAIFLVLVFQSSEKLASVYGISISTTMVATTILAYCVARERGHWKLGTALIFLLAFMIVDLAYFGSNLMRIPHGGWFPVAMGVVFFTIMSTWRRGGELLAKETDQDAITIEALEEGLQENKTARVPGTAVFLTPRMKDTPPALQHHVERNRALQKQVVLLTVLTEDVPRVVADERIEMTDLESGFYRVKLHYGYMQGVNVPSDLAACDELGLEIDVKDATYYVERQSPVYGRRKGGMIGWRDRLLAFLMRNTMNVTNTYRIPSAQTVELGLRVRI